MAALEKETLFQLAASALGEWDIEAPEIALHSVSENTVYRVTSGNGETYALRIHRDGYHNLEELNSELMWTSSLSDAGVNVPTPMLTRAGQGYATVPVPDSDEERHVGVMTWIDGVSLGSLLADEDVTLMAKHFVALGEVAARIHNQATTWNIPVGFRRHEFDAEGFVGDAPFWGPFWEQPALSPSERELVLKARSVIFEILSQTSKSNDLYSMIHADLHPYNMMINGDRLTVIDFDDAGYGWHQYEIAVALYNYLDSPHFDAMVTAMVQGYRELRALSDAALEALPMFFLIRSLAVMGWIDQRPELDNSEALPKLVKRACEQSEVFLSTQTSGVATARE